MPLSLSTYNLGANISKILSVRHTWALVSNACTYVALRGSAFVFSDDFFIEKFQCIMN